MSDALAVVGDRYSLPLLREMLYGYRRFSDLASLTGAPRTLLTGRLRRLEQAGVIERKPYSDHPPRFEYHLTAAGADLVPVILTLREWGERHASDAEPTVVFQHSCGGVFHPEMCCSVCKKQVTANDLSVVGGTHPPALGNDTAEQT